MLVLWSDLYREAYTTGGLETGHKNVLHTPRGILTYQFLCVFFFFSIFPFLRRNILCYQSLQPCVNDCKIKFGNGSSIFFFCVYVPSIPLLWKIKKCWTTRKKIIGNEIRVKWIGKKNSNQLMKACHLALDLLSVLHIVSSFTI